MTRPSNRIVDGKPVEIDEREGADNSAAHGYDTAPGKAHNARLRGEKPAPAKKTED